MVNDETLVNDIRLWDKNYLLLAIVYPKQFEKALIFLREDIKNILLQHINQYISVNEINNNKLEQLHSELTQLAKAFFEKRGS